MSDSESENQRADLLSEQVKSERSDSESASESTSDLASSEQVTNEHQSESASESTSDSVISDQVTSGHQSDTTSDIEENNTMATRTKLEAPAFGGEKSFEQYMMEVEAWCVVCSIPKKDQGVILALSLPDSDPTGVKDKLFHDIPISTLNGDDGVTKFKEFMNAMFKKDDLTMIYERYTQFEQCKRKAKQTVEE